jgi:hypothetical protein
MENALAEAGGRFITLQWQLVIHFFCNSRKDPNQSFETREPSLHRIMEVERCRFRSSFP